MDDGLLRAYERELDYLRREGGAFAQRFPRIAARLDLGEHASRDPHVEQLIESFAFLTGRLQRDIDAQFPRLAEAVLESLYPQLIAPVPPMAIAELSIDPDQAKMTGPARVARGMRLVAESEGLSCRFQTCYETEVAPVSVTGAALDTPDELRLSILTEPPPAVLKLTIEAAGARLDDYLANGLRIFVDAQPVRANGLFESLSCDVLWAGVKGVEEVECRPQPGARVEPVGFEPEHQVLPYPSHSEPAYRLLQEYIHFPEKFRFFDIKGLNFGGRSSADVLIGLRRAPNPPLRVEASEFRTCCTPIVNLFQRVSEPIRRTRRQHEYRLVADLQRESTTEVHTVLAVSSATRYEDPAAWVSPYFSYTLADENHQPDTFWLACRKQTLRPDLVGTDTWLSFVDRDLNESDPPEAILYAHAMCSNRILAEQLCPGDRLDQEAGDVPITARCVTSPTARKQPPLGGEAGWRLISQLSLNHLPLSGDEWSLSALKGLLAQNGMGIDSGLEADLGALLSLSSRPAVRQVGVEGWRGFVQGRAIELRVDEHRFRTRNAALFGAVLNHFLGLFASVNSFTELTLTSAQRRNPIVAWAPRTGERELI